MNLKDAINKRHSIRAYEKKAVPEKVLIELVNRAIKAPSASNRQPWKFHIVCSKKKRDMVAGYLRETLKMLRKDIENKPKKLQDVIYDFYNDLGGCQNIIFVFREKFRKEPAHLKPNDIVSISCAVENLMLTAVEKGLGTCWVGSLNGPIMNKKIIKLLNLPNNYELVAPVLIGYPKKGYKPLIRDKKSLREILKFC